MAWPKGVRPSKDGKSIQLRFQHRKRPVTKTLPWPPTEANVARAARFLEEWRGRVRYGLEDAGDVREGLGEGSTFREVAQEYLDGCGLKLSTRNSYRDALNVHWLPDLADLPISRIPYRKLRAVDRAIQWPSPKTRKNALTALRRVFGYAVEEDIIAENPAAQFRVRKIQKAAPDPHTKEERAAILAWADAHAPATPRLFLHLAFGTGMRTGELIALRWEDLHGRALRVERARVRRVIAPTKTDEVREVLLPAHLHAMLKNHPGRFAGGEILKTYRGLPYLSAHKLLKWYRRAMVACKIRERTGPYPWRHTYASIGLMTPNVDQAWLAQQLGHSLQTFHRVYARWMPSRKDVDQINRLDESWSEVGAGGDAGSAEGKTAYITRA